jgi:hypothetical protein
MKFFIVATAFASVVTAAVALHFYWQDRDDRLAAELAAEHQRLVETCHDDVELHGRNSAQARFSCGRVREIQLQKLGVDTSGMTINQINDYKN